mmetsp:Transcript_6696/g.24385  ORF Transcript_6696/g.24385 Transcript_6696/m.24385 type:complete len:216 (+) Transcript_6696:2412-3059(+)
MLTRRRARTSCATRILERRRHPRARSPRPSANCILAHRRRHVRILRRRHLSRPHARTNTIDDARTNASTTTTTTTTATIERRLRLINELPNGYANRSPSPRRIALTRTHARTNYAIEIAPLLSSTVTAYVAIPFGSPANGFPTTGNVGKFGHHSPFAAPVFISNVLPCAGHTIEQSSFTFALNSSVFPCMLKPKCGHLLLTAYTSPMNSCNSTLP